MIAASQASYVVSIISILKSLWCHTVFSKIITVMSHECFVTSDLSISTQTFSTTVQANNKENIQDMHHWPFVRGIHWWIPLSKYFHVMMPPCLYVAHSCIGKAIGSISCSPTVRSNYFCLTKSSLVKTCFWMSEQHHLLASVEIFFIVNVLFQNPPDLIIDLLLKSHNASNSYPTMHHFVTEMCTCVHISVTKWCIVGYLSSALQDLGEGSISQPFKEFLWFTAHL